jgi:hypothetical protein
VVSVNQSDVSDVRVVLGARGGVLKGELLDDITGQPIPKGKVTISDARKRGAFVEVSTGRTGHFRFAVPSKPVQIQATAPGYAVTNYQSGAEVILSGGEEREITILLHRK